MLPIDLIRAVQDTEQVPFYVEDEEDSDGNGARGVGASFFPMVARFNEENTIEIQLRTVFHGKNQFRLEVFGRGAIVQLTLKSAHELLGLFIPYMNDPAEGMIEVIGYLKDKKMWPEN